MTTRRTITIAILGAASLLASPAAGQDHGPLLGEWEMDRETPRGTVTTTLSFVEEGDSVVVRFVRGEESVTMGTADFDGKTVSFPLDMRAIMAAMRPGRGGGPMARPTGSTPLPRFTGTLVDDEIRGTMVGPRAEHELVLRRGAG